MRVEQVHSNMNVLEEQLTQIYSKEVERYIEKIRMLRDYFEKIGGYSDCLIGAYLKGLPKYTREEYHEKIKEAWQPMWDSTYNMFGHCKKEASNSFGDYE